MPLEMVEQFYAVRLAQTAAPYLTHLLNHSLMEFGAAVLNTFMLQGVAYRLPVSAPWSAAEVVHERA
jgi:hypothetical protein